MNPEAPAASSHLMPTYGRLPVAMSHGQGCWVWDVKGRRYLDALAGIAVNTLGHNHPRLVPALQEQVSRLIHTSNYYQSPLQEQLADELCKLSGLSNVFFCNSGLEANEAAIKVARKFGHDRGNTAPESWSSRAPFMAARSPPCRPPPTPSCRPASARWVPGFVRVKLNDIAAVEAALAAHPKLTAIFLETIQGEGGINPARIEFLQALRRLCDAHDLLLILDEVQCGIAAPASGLRTSGRASSPT